ncbi:MAG TPA: RNA polymerase sigma factor [Ktedonobacteraceae bacterium]|nr:RNA polymerase sigma factor [Ktedonobacteraceae bacterium]
MCWAEKIYQFRGNGHAVLFNAQIAITLFFLSEGQKQLMPLPVPLIGKKVLLFVERGMLFGSKAMDNDFTTLFDDLDDAELQKKLAENLDDYFHLFFEKYKRPVFKVARSFLGNVHDAEEVTSETFEQAAIALKEMLPDKQEIRFRPWLLKIVSNRCRNRKRHAARLKRPPSGVSLDEQATRDFVESLPHCQYCSAEQEAIRNETISEIYIQLGQLQANQHEVVTLHYLGGLSYPEIASMLNRSLEAIKKDGSRGIHRLQELCSRNQIACY